MPKIYIILVNWNGREDTLECLRSLKDLAYNNYAIIVVDNNSNDDSVQEIKQRFPDVILLQNRFNSGFAGGNNRGIRYALKQGADYVWLLNNDTVVEPQALSALVGHVEEEPFIGICGSKVIYYDQPQKVQVWAGGSYNKWLGLPKNFGQFSSVEKKINTGKIESNLDFVIGASMLVSRSFLEEIGLLSEDYFLYYEEIDWGIRAEGKFTLGFAPQSIVYHKEGASIGATSRDVDNKSRLSDYYHIKNRLKLTCKFYPWRLPGAYLTTLYSIFNRMMRGQWDRIPMIVSLMFSFNNNKRYSSYKRRDRWT